MYAARYKKKRSFWKNVNFGLVALAFHYGSCFNASLSRLLCKFILYLKKFCKNNSSKPVLTTPWKVSCSPAHVSIKS